MKVVTSSVRLLATVLMLAYLSTATQAAAQAAGNNTIYAGSPTASLYFSSSYVDASVLPQINGGSDICQRIVSAMSVLTTTYNGAGVIDARGINTSNSAHVGTSLTCASNPWGGSGPYPQAVILLPAGTIVMTSIPWTLPDRTRLIGVGSGVNPTSGTGVTTLKAGSGAGGTMIQMGAANSAICTGTSPNYICNGVGIEDVRLDGNNFSVIGIWNQYAQELSYVNRVAFYQVKGTGLKVGGVIGSPTSAQNSGPYTNIRFDYPNTSNGPTTSTVCAQIIGGNTRGIHGLTCSNVSSTATPNVAINVDSTSNSIEDVSINGFTDGIQVGANASAQSNTLLNISGAFSSSSGSLIHLCAGLSGGCGSTSNSVTDVSIIGATNTSTGGNLIVDEVSGSSTAPTTLTDSHVGIYVLGEKVSSASGAGYTRFSTSPSVPTWIVGSNSLTPGSACNASPGSLYSNTSGTSAGNDTLYVCIGGTTGSGWQFIK